MTRLYGNKEIYTDDVTIPDLVATSSSVEADGMALIGFSTDADLDGTGLTFEVSSDNTTWAALASVSSITVTTSKHYNVDPVDEYIEGWKYIRVISGSNQSGAVSVIGLIFKNDSR